LPLPLTHPVYYYYYYYIFLQCSSLLSKLPPILLQHFRVVCAVPLLTCVSPLSLYSVCSRRDKTRLILYLDNRFLLCGSSWFTSNSRSCQRRYKPNSKFRKSFYTSLWNLV